MLLTNSTWRSPHSLMQSDPNNSYWLCAELVFENPWFMVCLSQIKDDDPVKDFQLELTRTMFVFDIVAVEEFVNLQSEGEMQLRAVHIVTSGHTNDSGNWQMDRLAAVWTAAEPSAPGQRVEMYETLSGQIYGYSMLGTPLNSLVDRKLRFRLPLL